uniref:Olfactory receptor n=1 Tax=Pelusios castaneus TaxID=367368 RepID=A0A8C8SAD4_9SAUR
MADRNYTKVTLFIFSGLTDLPELKFTLALLFLVTYLLTVVGNLGMILLIRIDSQLHTPMYFFLSNLSFLDICYSCTISPKMLLDLLAKRRVISFAGCLTQFCFYVIFATTEVYLLAAMAYDRYVAICNPLLYTAIMSRRLCVWLVAGSYLVGSLNSIIHTSAMLRLSFCGPNIINNFYCDGPPLFVLSCTDTHINEIMMFVFVGLNLITTQLFIIVSYAYILATILRIPSAEGRRKAFSTCTSHLTAVMVLYGSFVLVYLQPSSSSAVEEGKVASVFSTVVIPLLNPFIYSLRNKEVKDALRKVIRRKLLCS